MIAYIFTHHFQKSLIFLVDNFNAIYQIKMLNQQKIRITTEITIALCANIELFRVYNRNILIVINNVFTILTRNQLQLA